MPRKCLTASASKLVDERLLGEYKYSIDQLLELAGYGIYISLREHLKPKGKILVACGPGNNGGDGLVLARHLHLNNHTVHLFLPKPVESPHLLRLLEQCKAFGVEQKGTISKSDSYDHVIDALLGFGFRPPLRQPFDSAIEQLVSLQVPIISIDVPSGWIVDSALNADSILRPSLLVSMTAPKPCSQGISDSNHLLVDWFIPPALAEEIGKL